MLVVDDTKMNLTVMRGLLKETKIHLDEAESGQECLALTEKTKYDVILLDHRMPCHHHDDDQEELPDWLSGIQHLDTAMGLQNCGSAKDYLEALRIFRESVAEKADAIEGFLGAKDWQNATPASQRRRKSPTGTR